MLQNYTITELGSGMVRITAKCQITNFPHSVTVKRSEFDLWRSGVLAQDVFKTLSAEDREFLISGFSPLGWELTFRWEAAQPDGSDIEMEDEENEA